MRKLFILIQIFLCFGSNAQNVGIGTNNPNTSAKLEVNSTNSGFLPPRLTISQRNAITNPASGLLIWCTDCLELQVYNGTFWTTTASAPICTITPPAPSNDTSSDLTNILLPDPEDYGNGSNSDVSFAKLLVNGTSFQQIYQKTSGISCGGSACLPTSYMIARAINYPNRNFSIQELNSIISGMGMVCGVGTGIVQCQTYAKSDIGTCNPSLAGTTNRETAKNYIKDNIEKGLPVISLILIKSNTSTSSTNYLSETTGLRHFVTIVGIKLTTTGIGSTIFYIDPLDQTKIVREADYTTFLNSCLAASSANLYNLLAIGCEADVTGGNNYGNSYVPILTSPANNAQNVPITISLNWQSSISGTIYRIQISKSQAGWTSTNGFPDNSNRVMNRNTSIYNSTYYNTGVGGGATEGAQFNTTYYWTVKSYVNGVSSDYCAPQSFKTANAVITAPVATAANNITTSGFTMNWNGQNPISVGYYNTLISTDSNFVYTLPNWESNVTHTNLTWNSLNSNTWYYYKIRIVTPTGASPWSNVISVKTN